MPRFQKLTERDLQKRREERAATPLLPYLEFLQGLQPGEGGVIEPGEGETFRMVKRRLSMAAHRLGILVRHWQEAGKVYFQVKSRDQS